MAKRLCGLLKSAIVSETRRVDMVFLGFSSCPHNTGAGLVPVAQPQWLAKD